ncbi:hypothetical protein EV182_006472, partial [Spiromyces aspiralis]
VEVRQWRGEGIVPRDELIQQAKCAQGLLCMLTDKIDKEFIDSVGSNVKVVSTMSVGYDHIDISAAKAKGIALGYTPDVLTDATADTTVLLALAVARRAKEAIDAVRNGE